jgi:hypothetical protein
MSAAKQQLVKYFFYEIKMFPLVLGCRWYLKAPTINDHGYICRKGCHALNIQCVCDENCLFLNVVAKWVGIVAIAFRA